MRTVSLIDIASYLPKNRVSADYYAQFAESDDLADNVMFKAPAYRHHVSPDETAPDMVERALEPLLERHGAKAIRDVDVLIAHTQIPDMPIIGSGGDIARRLGANPEWLIDLHNSGCASFVYSLKLARHLLATTDAKSALICNASNAAGQIFDQTDVRKLSQAAIPGDAAAVGLLTVSDESPILDVEARHYTEFAGDMTLAAEGRKYWEEGENQIKIGFTEAKIAKVLARGNRQVPEVTSALCDRIGVSTTDIDVFVTNQPNRVFLRNWSEAVRPKSYPDTFDGCGNLFGAAVPVTLDREIREGRVPDGSLVVMAGFAHAGDFAAAAAVRWRGSS
jgi:3-oxoacyl-[acyl-carrier-protein] synthase-3